jgi:RNA polymerase sigma factor (sigma-70 family)
VNSDRQTHITDADLLKKFYADTNNEWLGILLQRYTLLLLGTCMKYLKNETEARDAVQQIFLKVLKELPRHKVDYFKSWLYAVARNYCLMQLRNKNIFLLTDDIQPLAYEETDKYELLSKERFLSYMEDALNELNIEQQTCIKMFYMEKKSYQEIVTASGFELTQVKSFIQNGKRNLKIIIERKMKETE